MLSKDEILQTIHMIDQQHFFCSLIRPLIDRSRHHRKRRLDRLYQQAVIADVCGNLSSVIENIFAHHGSVCDFIQTGQLSQ